MSEKQPSAAPIQQASVESPDALGDIGPTDLTAKDADAVKGGSSNVMARYDQTAKNVIQNMRG